MGPTMGPTQPPIPGVMGTLSREVKRPGCEAGHSHLFSRLIMRESRGIDRKYTSPCALTLRLLMSYIYIYIYIYIYTWSTYS